MGAHQTLGKKMILNFSNPESASMRVAKLRAEGHFAELCDEASAALWGPSAVGGVRVIATDEPVTEDCVPTTKPDVFGEFGNSIRIVVIALWLVAASWIGLIFILTTLRDPLGSVAVLLILAGTVYGMAGVSILWHRVLSASIIRSADKKVSDPTFSLVLAIVLVACVGIFVTDFG